MRLSHPNRSWLLPLISSIVLLPPLVALDAPAAVAGIADTPLPQFSDGTSSSVVSLISGVVKRGSRLETLFVCTSLAQSPLHIGVEIFGPDGGLLNDVHAGIGAVLDVPPLATVTIATSATASYLESAVIPLAPISQGSARVVASAGNVRCTTMIVDGAVVPPVSLASLSEGARLASGPILPTRALPTFSGGTPATHAAVIPGVIKRGPMETNVFCTSLASSAVDIGVEVFATDGTPMNSIAAGDGAALGVLPGQTVTFGTAGTAAFLEDVILPIDGVSQGLARIVASSADVICSATVADENLMPPAALSEMPVLGCRDASTAATCAGSGSALPALPTFSDGKPSVLASEFSGVTKRGRVQTDILCSSTASSPVNIGVEIFDGNGVRLNDVNAGAGALLNVAPGATVTFGTTGTAAYLESQVLSILGVSQGYARVVASSSAVRCAAVLLDDAVTPPASLGTLAPAVHPVAGSQIPGSSLPSFSNSVAATHAALVPALIKRDPMQTVFFCTSRAAVPVHVGVQLFSPDGSLLNDINANNGAVLNVMPGETVTIGSSSTAAFLETTSIITAGAAQGFARIVASSPAVVCSAVVLDSVLGPPASLGGLTVAGCRELPALPVCGSQATTPTATASRSTTPTVTATRTYTPTRTATGTPTRTPTFTASRSSTRSPTRTPTPSPSRSPTVSPTQPLSTATATLTTTRTPTSTPTQLASRTPTTAATPTPSSNPTASTTHTSTTTATPALSATRTPSHTPTLSPSRTASRTATAALTTTRTPTSTSTRSPSRTPTPTTTPTPSSNPTAPSTQTAANTATGTLPPTPTHTPTPSRTPSSSPTSSATQTAIDSATGTLPPTPTATQSLSHSPTTAATPPPSSTPSRTPTASHTETATAPATPTQTPTVDPSASPSHTPTMIQAPTSSPSPPPPGTSTPAVTTSPSATSPPASTATLTSSPTPAASATRRETAPPTGTAALPTATSPGATRTAAPAELGDANCDGKLGAADLTALVFVRATGLRSECGLDDVNGDGRIDSEDSQVLIERIFAGR